MNSDEIYETLETEFKELIEKLESEILELENSDNIEIINSLFRAIHTIKGNSAMVGMNKLKSISHSLETLFAKLRAKEILLETEMIEVSLKSIDRMKEIIFDLKNENNYEVKDLLTALDRILKKEIAPKPMQENYQIDNLPFFLETAKSENKYLSLVQMNLEENTDNSLSEWIHKITTLEKEIVLKKIDIEHIAPLSANKTNYPFPYQILLLTQEKPELFLLKHKLPFSNIKFLSEPEMKVLEESTSTVNNNSTTTKQTSVRTNSYLKVPTKIIDDLINLAGETVIARNQLISSLNLEEDSEQEIRMNRVSLFINNIYNQLMHVRLQKLNSIFPRLQRVVRDTAKATGKEINLFLEGQDIDLDELVLEGISESLLHILRNSIDHGICFPEERIALGKPKQGNIVFRTSLKSGNIIIEIKDDGKGLNYQKIKEKAIHNGMFSQEEIETFSEEKLRELIFLPGFSTSETVSSVSGRGVGMDVVLTNFKKFGGSVKIESEQGKGTTIIGIIPQTLSVMPAFIISVSGNKFAILQKHILELSQTTNTSILNLDNRKIFQRNEDLIPFIDLNELLFSNSITNTEPVEVAILNSDDKIFAISFDHLLSIEEIVLKPVPDQLKEIDLYGGTTFSGDGSAILLLEPDGIIKFSKINLEKNISTNVNSIKKQMIQNSYLGFEVSSQIFLVNASDILHVYQIKNSQIQTIFDKEMIQLEKELIPSFRLEKFFDIKIESNLETMYCLIVRSNNTTIGILTHYLIDIFESIEIKENNVIENQFIEGIYSIDNRTGLFVNLPKIIQNSKIELGVN